MGTRSLWILIGSALLILTFQNCSRPLDFSSEKKESPSPQMQNGNGEGYGGKLTRYEFIEPQQPCHEKGRLGQALPNDQIFSYEQGGSFLVRQNCRDLMPQKLAPTDLNFQPNGELIFGGKSYIEKVQTSDFEMIAASCPVGLKENLSAQRSNWILDSQNLLSSAWNSHPGITVEALGVLGSLPLFSIQRSDPNQLDLWRRHTQDPVLTANQSYVLSFLVRSQPGQSLYFGAYNPSSGLDFEVLINPDAGTTQTLASQNVVQVTTSFKPFAGGVFVSIYFTPTVNGYINVGVTSGSTIMSASVAVTAFQLEPVANFCGP